MKKNKKRVVFDIETEPFSDAFLNAKTVKEKLEAVPNMRVACVFE